MRSINLQYSDPLDVIWISAAEHMGMRVERSDEVFAAWDGQGTLKIGTPETLDADDTLAQMVLHETCHALVEGPDAFSKPDWGLDITDRSQLVHEHACLRLQAALAQPHGLRQFFASTTDARRYYDNLPDDPLTGDDDPATKMALAGFERAATGPWAEPLQAALAATARIADIIRPHVDGKSLWSADTTCHSDGQA
ncbi:MAG: hypothetical protein AB8G99_07915 [Planctomycetaceae bacterium]